MIKSVLTLILFSLSIFAKAQTVGYTGALDETMFPGVWQIYSAKGEFPQLDSYPEGTCVFGSHAGFMGKDLFKGWFISNSNKLHFIMADQHHAMFIISKKTEFSDGDIYVMLTTFDGNSYIEMVRHASANSVEARAVDTNAKPRNYNLQGIEVENPSGIYIKDGKKYISK